MTDLKNTWTTGETYAASDQNNIATAANAAFHAIPGSGILSSRPTAASTNNTALYLCTDNDTHYQSNGTSWVKVRIGADSCDSMGDVPTTGWTGVNMPAGASWASDKDAMLFTIPSTGTTPAIQYQYRAYPTPPFTLTTYLDQSFVANSAPAASSEAFSGLVISDGTKLITLGSGWDTFSAGGFTGVSRYLVGFKWTNTTTASGAYGTGPLTAGWLGGIPKWFRFVDDNTNIKWQYSFNGIDWSTYASEARTTFLTPTRIGVYGFNYSGQSIVMRARSWNGVS